MSIVVDRSTRCLIGLALAALPLTGCALPLDTLTGVAAGAASGTLAYVKTNLDPEKATVATGEVITLWVETNVPERDLRFAWSATAGALSATSGARVRWTAGGSGRVVVRCTVTHGAESRPAEYLFTVR
ncbi:MAG: hypothetical protein VKS61_13580 [Candidatus Sericytochromatia bacterium]|jgi:hypothetical protein|nr:hypothetical protein [Candidatus Sericytochromatia bacterium]